MIGGARDISAMLAAAGKHSLNLTGPLDVTWFGLHQAKRRQCPLKGTHSRTFRAEYPISRSEMPERPTRPTAARNTKPSGCYTGVGTAVYIRSILSAYFWRITRRFSLRVGVSSSDSAVHSDGRMVKRLICSCRETCWFDSATARSTSAFA